LERVAIAQGMEAGGAENEACGHEPKAGGLGAAVEGVGKCAATQETNSRCELYKNGGVVGGFGLGEGKFIVQESGEPTVKEPESENENWKDQAKDPE